MKLVSDLDTGDLIVVQLTRIADTLEGMLWYIEHTYPELEEEKSEDSD